MCTRVSATATKPAWACSRRLEPSAASETAMAATAPIFAARLTLRLSGRPRRAGSPPLAGAGSTAATSARTRSSIQAGAIRDGS